MQISKKILPQFLVAVFIGGCTAPQTLPTDKISLGFTKADVHRTWGTPEVAGTLEKVNMDYEVYWRTSVKSEFSLSDRSAWTVLYRNGAVVRVEEWFEGLPTEIGDPIKKHYYDDLKVRNEKSLEKAKNGG